MSKSEDAGGCSGESREEPHSILQSEHDGSIRPRHCEQVLKDRTARLTTL